MRARIEPSTELHCEHCGYDVSSLPHRRCPECGAIYDPHALRLTYDRANQTLRRARRHLFSVPVVGGAIIGVLLGLARTPNAAIGVVALYFVIVGYLVALATLLAPDVVQARRALGRHGGASEPRLILMYGAGLIILQLSIMTGMAALAMSIVRAMG